MTPAAQLQYEIGRAVATLRRRRAGSGDAAEKKKLARSIRELDAQVVALDTADSVASLAVANALAEALEAIETAVGAVRHGPFEGYLTALENHFDQIAMLSAALHADCALAPAPDDGEPARAAPKARSARARGPTGVPPLATATDFPSLQDEYAAWYAACEVRPQRQGELAYCCKRLAQGRASYEQVGAELGIPWTFIGITHGMECGFNFKGHLHNGDPLGAPTVHVPKGRPASGNPPYAWNESARDALIYKGYHEVKDWSVAHMLYLFERYNGMGYRRRGLATPYLWSYSNLYEKGKFVADGRFDPEAVSRQCGAALMLKAVLA